VWAAFVLAYALWIPHTFLTTTTLQSVLGDQAITGIVALGMVVSLAAGAFDLSFATLLTMAAVLDGSMMADWHLAPGLAIGLTLLAGMAVGAVNGLLVTKVGVSSIVATLGMSSLIQAVIDRATNGGQFVSGFPKSFTELASPKPLGVPILAVYLLVAALIVWYLLEHAPFGRRLQATGAGLDAARLAGVGTDRMMFAGLMASSLMATIGGILVTAPDRERVADHRQRLPGAGVRRRLPRHHPDQGRAVQRVGHHRGHLPVGHRGQGPAAGRRPGLDHRRLQRGRTTARRQPGRHRPTPAGRRPPAPRRQPPPPLLHPKGTVMKLATFTHPDTGRLERTGVVDGTSVVDPLAVLYGSYGGGLAAAARAAAEAPRDMVGLFTADAVGKGTLARAVDIARQAMAKGDALLGPDHEAAVVPLDQVRLLAPVPRPPRIRDYLTYEEHANGAGRAVPPAFNQMPICYKCNCDSIIGPDETIVWPAYSDQLDYELEIGFFVGRAGRNLSVEEAGAAIVGVTYFNDVSARDIQLWEMSLGIGPSKGKDFCSVMGPWITTIDELDEWAIELEARVNGETWSKGTTEHRRYSFAEVLAWASYCEDIQPGEFLAVGTVGGGCGIEIDKWIRPGDVVEFVSPQLGHLRNPVGQPEAVPAGAGLASYQGAPRYTVGPK
jgi:2-keto-4-pentenoate hydratase/2-oxohepta-3-ene-1,7-dioic acid hydratase in catechol pathway/ABC-type uncharacterized transport system permease subunit